ncbi:MAG: hypothetical protein ONB31_01685 [candidate division KSB1 bacterium]|nr:hypothetical protein [candidate division KSB1 bacterium]
MNFQFQLHWSYKIKAAVISIILTLFLLANLSSQQIFYNQEFQVNTYTNNDQKNPVVAPLQDGGFMVVWQSNEQDGSEWGIYGQLFDHNGIKKGEEFRVNSFTNRSQYNSSLTVLKNGKIVVCWQSLFQTGSSYDIIGQIFDGAGNKLGGEFPINTYIDDWQDFPSITALHDGGFVVCWRMWARDRVYYQIYDSLGVKKGDEVWMPVDFNNYTEGEYPIIHSLDDSGFMICWTNDPISIYYSNIFGQIFDDFGNKKGEVFQINTYTMGTNVFLRWHL